MLRKRAIRSLLVAEVAGLKAASPATGEGGEEEGEAASPGTAEVLAEVQAEAHLLQHEALEQAERRALFVVGLDWAAIVALFLLRDPAAPFLPAGPTVETVFTLGVLAVAVHSGFRLGQLEKYRAVRRVWDDLAD